MTKTISATEHKIYTSAYVGRMVRDRVKQEFAKRGFNAINTNLKALLWHSDVLVTLLMAAIEIKVCMTANGNHKNCAKAFKDAQGAAVSWLKRGYKPYFLFVDAVEGATGHEHEKYITELISNGIGVTVFSAAPRDHEIAAFVQNIVDQLAPRSQGS